MLAMTVITKSNRCSWSVYDSSDRVAWSTKSKDLQGAFILAKQISRLCGLKNIDIYPTAAMLIFTYLSAPTDQLKQHCNWKNEGTSLKFVLNTKSEKLIVANMLNQTRSPFISKTTVYITNCENIIVNV